MIEWWNSLELIQHFFYAIGIIAMIVTVFQLLLTILGVGLDSVDIDFDPDIAQSTKSAVVRNTDPINHPSLSL